MLDRLWIDRWVHEPQATTFPRIVAWCCGQMVELEGSIGGAWTYHEPEWDVSYGYDYVVTDFRWWMPAPKPPEDQG